MRMKIEHEGKVLGEVEFDTMIACALSNVPGGISTAYLTAGVPDGVAAEACQALHRVVQDVIDEVIREHCGKGGSEGADEADSD